MRSLVLGECLVRRVSDELMPETEAHLLVERIQIGAGLLVEADELLAHERHEPHQRGFAFELRTELRDLGGAKPLPDN